MLGPIVLGVIVATLIGVWVRRRHQGRRRRSPIKELVGLCRGDTAQAQRLIAAERRRAPQLGDAEAARRAIKRWRRDMR